MSEKPRQPVLHLIACGARPAGDLEPFIKTCQELGWDIFVIATPAASKYIDRNALTQLTGHAVRDDKQPDELDVLPPADAVAVAPASFNMINKWAYGNSDNEALELLNEATGLGLPILAVPAPDAALAKHPAFAESVARLCSWGVTMVFPPTLYPVPAPDMGKDAADIFPWHAAEEVVSGWTRFALLPPPGAGLASREMAISGT